MSCGFREADVLDMPIDKFRAYVASATYMSSSNRLSYIHDLVSVISGLFGKKDNKIITNHIKSLDM